MRVIGYVLAAIVGLGVGAFFGLFAIAESMCGTWGEQCTATQETRITRLWLAACASPFVAVGIYAVFDQALTAWWRRRS